jgi:hypothetical protein
MTTPPAVDELLERTEGCAFFGVEEHDRSRTYAPIAPADVMNCRMIFLANPREVAEG